MEDSPNNFHKVRVTALMTQREPVWPAGKCTTSVPVQASAILSSKMGFVDTSSDFVLRD